MVNKAAETTGISERTTIQVYQYIRDICTTKLLHTPPRLSGPGVVIQINESLFLPQGKVQPRSSDQQGTVGFWTRRHIRKTSHHMYAESGQTWCWHSSTDYTTCVTTGNHHTLSYHRIQEKIHLEHATVNHHVNFVDPETGVHTQTIESCWARTKLKFKTMKGVSTDALPSYLDDRMWRDRWRKTTEDAFSNLCAHIAEH